MTTLLISIYDCDTQYSAAIINEFGTITPIDFSRNMIYVVLERHCFIRGHISDPDIRKEETKKINKFQKLLNSYDHVIICENGEIEQVK